MKILVTGTAGQLATSLMLAPQSGMSVTAIGRPTLDVAKRESIMSAVVSAMPDVVVSAAAYTAVDKAESEPDVAHAANALGAGYLADACTRIGAILIHLSTDYVFDGTAAEPYVESAQIGPQSVYGKTKLAGEDAIRQRCARHIILRTAWVYSPFGNNFVKTMLRLAASRDEIGVVDDQHGSPTYAPHLADAILTIAAHCKTAGRMPVWGTYHATGAGFTTWAGFAREIFAQSAARGGPAARVKSIATADYPTPARRPANSRLDCSALHRTFGITLPRWQDGVADCVDRLLATTRMETRA
jgi:dTDP-4-dehydrorhamnose reductase